jgi:nucleoside 2-deoxyribosyltransferase
MSKVYLAGPIAGLNYEGATEWRDIARQQLYDCGIQGVSPMRGKEYLRDVRNFDSAGNYGNFSCMSSARGITTRDRYDATHCDVMLVNLLGANKVSIGTVMELGWADANRIPIVCVMEEGNIHDHGMINEVIGFKVETLEEALHIVKIILAKQ